MIFATPWVLAALFLLPLLWWLLRATPPAPRAQDFPAIRLLAGLRPAEETPARTPWWLLALRIAAAGLVILGLASPTLSSGGWGLAAGGPALLVLDDGWASAPDFAARIRAADGVLDRLDQARRPAQLLTTAPATDGQAPAMSAVMPARLLRQLVDAAVPHPWPVARDRAAPLVGGTGPVFYISDGLATSVDAPLAHALAARGQVTILHGDAPARVLGAQASAGTLQARLRQTAWPTPRTEFILAETGDGRVLARAPLLMEAGSRTGIALVDLPPELRNQLGSLRLEGAPGAGGVALLDEASRRRPVGLVSGTVGSQTPLLGEQYYLERSLGPTTELRRGTVAALLTRPISVIVETTGSMPPDDASALLAWVKRGGLLVRFAAAGMAPQPDASGLENAPPDDPLLPARLLPGDRQLGGAMSWSQPAHLAPFPAGSPFAGLRIPAEVTVSRQVLADPAAEPAPADWARLADGTPLVTEARQGAGEVVLFHVTANADWSNLPLSGLFVDMMGRLVRRAAGVEALVETRLLAPASVLDGFGVLGTPGPSVRAISASDIGRALPSPAHPPGFYGPDRDRHALDLAGAALDLAAMSPIAGAREMSLAQAPRETRLGPWLVGAALALLAVDMILTLWLRGLLRGVLPARAHSGIAAGFMLACALASGAASAESPALQTHLAYVVTGDAQVDATSRSGLAGLSDYVNARTAAVLGDPVGVVPGRDDLGYFPLLYLPVTPDLASSPKWVGALNDYMHHGGIVLIDLRGGDTDADGSGAGAAPDAAAALRRIGAGLDVPRLAPLTGTHVLAHAFYLLQEFPGRFDGGTVWVQQDQDRSNDSVSPVIVGANDWAAAWAQDEDGNPLFATVPGGARQRTLAYRFGVNLVMYALTGNYKGDQVHVPAILQRLGQ